MHKRNALQTELPAHLTGVSKLIFRTYYLQNHSYYQHLSAICYRQKNNNVASKQERRPQEAPSQINCPNQYPGYHDPDQREGKKHPHLARQGTHATKWPPRA
jgi:hypothetical protein